MKWTISFYKKIINRVKEFSKQKISNLLVFKKEKLMLKIIDKEKNKKSNIFNRKTDFLNKKFKIYHFD